MGTTTITTTTVTMTTDVSVRKRVSIPTTDSATLDWWDAQEDVATSLRLMILEEVAEHGYMDRLARIAAATPAPEVDPRDAEIASLKAQLAARPGSRRASRP